MPRTTLLRATFGVLLTMAPLVLAACVGAMPERREPAEGSAVVAAGDSVVAAGMTTFEAKCATCHTIGGGPLVGPDLAGVRYSLQETNRHGGHPLEEPLDLYAAERQGKVAGLLGALEQGKLGVPLGGGLLRSTLAQSSIGAPPGGKPTLWHNNRFPSDGYYTTQWKGVKSLYCAV